MPSWPVWKGRKTQGKDLESNSQPNGPNNASQAAQEGHSMSSPVPASGDSVELAPLDRTLSISSLRVRDINLPTSTPSSTESSPRKDDAGTLSTHLRAGTPSSMLPLRPDSSSSVASYFTRENPKVARIRPRQSSAAMRYSPDPKRAVFVSQPMPVEQSCAQTADGIELYRLSHAVPTLLAPFNYLVGLDALRGVTTPVMVPRDEHGKPLFDIEIIHPRDRALLLVLTYAGLPDDVGGPSVRHWLAPFSISDDELHCWREGEIPGISFPSEITLGLHTFAAHLHAWQHPDADGSKHSAAILNRWAVIFDHLKARHIPLTHLSSAQLDSLAVIEDMEELSSRLDALAVAFHGPIHSTFEHVENVRPGTAGGASNGEPTELYAYRFSHSAPLGEIYDPRRDKTPLGTVRKKPNTTSSSNNNLTNNAITSDGNGNAVVQHQGISITRVFQNGKEAYKRSAYAKWFKLVYAMALGISVVAVVVAVCFFRLGQKRGEFDGR